LATVRTVSAECSMPIFTASTPMSSTTASIWSMRICDGTAWIERTPSVFCAVSAVIAVMPKQPSAAMVFRSAWMPAPPPLSDPAMDRTRAYRKAASWFKGAPSRAKQVLRRVRTRPRGSGLQLSFRRSEPVQVHGSGSQHATRTPRSCRNCDTRAGPVPDRVKPHLPRHSRKGGNPGRPVFVRSCFVLRDMGKR
jgi:hypothetical protein